MHGMTLPENDELSFMNGLLAGIDNSFFDAVPSPDPSPKKIKASAKSCAKPAGIECNSSSPNVKGTTKSNEVTESDLASLLEGAENWDWNDMELDACSVNNPKKVYVGCFDLLSS